MKKSGFWVFWGFVTLGWRNWGLHLTVFKMRLNASSGPDYAAYDGEIVDHVGQGDFEWFVD